MYMDYMVLIANNIDEVQENFSNLAAWAEANGHKWPLCTHLKLWNTDHTGTFEEERHGSAGGSKDHLFKENTGSVSIHSFTASVAYLLAREPFLLQEITQYCNCHVQGTIKYRYPRRQRKNLSKKSCFPFFLLDTTLNYNQELLNLQTYFYGGL